MSIAFLCTFFTEGDAAKDFDIDFATFVAYFFFSYLKDWFAYLKVDSDFPFYLLIYFDKAGFGTLRSLLCDVPR